MSESPEIQSAFNMGLATLQRIDLLLKDCNNYSNEDLLAEWKKTLDSLYREIKPHLMILKKTKKNKGLSNKHEDLDNVRIFANSALVNFHKIKNQEKASELYSALDKYELLIRQKLHLKGMLLPTKDDPNRALFG